MIVSPARVNKAQQANVASKLYRFNLEAGKAAALGHTWSGATHAPGLGRKGGKKKGGKKKKTV